jgi:hypothetical protein
MSQKKKNKKPTKQNPFSFGPILIIIGMISGFYAYQYYMRPEINILNVDTQYIKETKEDDMRIRFSFKLKNDGKSKTKNSRLFSVFPKWGINGSGITVSPYDSVYSDIFDLIEDKETTFITYKDINFDDFIQYTNMAGGLYLVVILRWQSDNITFWGRTFENHMLFFLQSGMKDDKMVFQIQQVKQEYFTRWFTKETEEPDMFKTVKDLGATRFLYGDVSRFD